MKFLKMTFLPIFLKRVRNRPIICYTIIDCTHLPFASISMIISTYIYIYIYVVFSKLSAHLRNEAIALYTATYHLHITCIIRLIITVSDDDSITIQ